MEKGNIGYIARIQIDTLIGKNALSLVMTYVVL